MNKRLTKNSPQTIGGVRTPIAFREMFANAGYEEGAKRILAKQAQQIFEREKQPHLTRTIAQSTFQ